MGALASLMHPSQIGTCTLSRCDKACGIDGLGWTCDTRENQFGREGANRSTDRSAMPAKYKLLTAMAISIAIRCEPCIRAYVRMVIEQGAVQEEALEFLNVAMTMQGCPGEEWAMKAYAAYKETISEHQPDQSAGCCVQDNPGSGIQEGDGR